MPGHGKNLYAKAGFSLVESVTALIILALISSSVFVVIDRCMAVAADSALRMQAFETARENMEELLASASVSEMTEYGASEKNPHIQWQRTVETFYEPSGEEMWVQAICSAEYTDSAGQVQAIELTSWITSLTRAQLVQMAKQKQKQQALLDSEDDEPEADQDESDQEDISDQADKTDIEKDRLGDKGQKSTKDKEKQKQSSDKKKQTSEPQFDPENMSWDELMEYVRQVFGRQQ
jgi:prepilin-type N-terminal cleavage/methylation domain-containing protein